ncbi:metallophosphoesterase, partial [Listeria monocytogenes]|nr:metallophosphoesterase [Listeria monocytogenes]
MHEADTPLQQASNSEFWLLSDIHFLSSTLHDNGEAFQTFTQGAAGKEMTYQEQSIEAFTAQALKEKPTGIILTGDMTLNGEKASAQELARLLAPLQEADIMVFALPGNHEIYNGWARAFKGEKEYYADQISPEDFQTIFAEGYEKAYSIDKSSLSYSIQLNDKYRLFLLDSCIYDSEVNWDDPTTNGELKPATLTWLEEQLTLTKEAEQVPLVFLHHNLFSHNELLQDGYVLDNASETVALLDRFNVPAVFSGHIHIQD